MHNTAMEHGRLFFETYVKDPSGKTIVDLGSQDVNGSLRSVAPAEATYIGVDFDDAKGVDVVISDPYSLPFDDQSVDVCVSSSCFEHSEFFWLVFLEVTRISSHPGFSISTCLQTANSIAIRSTAGASIRTAGSPCRTGPAAMAMARRF